MKKPLKWLLGIVVVCGIGALLTWAFIEGRAEMEKERQREMPVKPPSRAERGSSGETVVVLDADAQAALALKIEPLAAATHQPELLAYGHMEEDPAQTFVVRAPVAGVIQSKDWPAQGKTLASGAVVGEIEPRWSPKERVDLALQRADISTRISSARAAVANGAAAVESAKSEYAAARSGLTTLQTLYQRTKKLNTESKLASDKEVDEAGLRVTNEEARVRNARAKITAEEASLKAAEDALKIIESSLGLAEGTIPKLPLSALRSGQIVAVLVHPGEAVESGQELLRVASFDSGVARVSLSVGEQITAPQTARIAIAGQESRTFNAELIGLAPLVDSAIGTETILYKVRATELRPGSTIIAYLPTSGEALKGVVIPRSALVRFTGKVWAYVEISAGKYSRREVTGEYMTDAGWFTATGFNMGDRVVVTGVQMLLSEELKSLIKIGDEGENK